MCAQMSACAESEQRLIVCWHSFACKLEQDTCDGMNCGVSCNRFRQIAKNPIKALDTGESPVRDRASVIPSA